MSNGSLPSSISMSVPNWNNCSREEDGPQSLNPNFWVLDIISRQLCFRSRGLTGCIQSTGPTSFN